MNRKLRKFLRDPSKFLRDSRLFGSPRVAVQAVAAPVAPSPAPVAPGPVPVPVIEVAAKPQPAVAAVLAVAPEAVAVAKPAAKAAPEPDPEPITGIEGYEAFALHGRNWLDDSAKPVAVLWGVGAAHRDIIAQYLPEHRAAFVNPKTKWPKVEANLDRLEGLRFIFWSGSGDEVVREYANRRGIATARMADGPIRSVSRGRDRSGPLSIVLDESGLDPSGALERLLGEHDFAASKSLMKSVPALMRLHRKLRICKYSNGSFASALRLLGPKLRRRVLVLHDRPGASTGADAWTPRRLVELAAAEHPGAEIIFRPHPDDVKAWRKGSAAAAELAPLCRVLPDDVALPDLLQSADQVYVVASLAGMEALLHGVPVTVLGAPFYAGWGLTDDREAAPRRGRQLGLEELYCAVYLLSPRYLADLDDPVTGCLATMIRVAGERRRKLDAAVTPELVYRHGASIAMTDYWPTLLRPANLEQVIARYDRKLLRVFSIERAFADSKAERFQRSLAYLLVGCFQNIPAAAGYLSQIRASVRIDVYRQVLMDLWRMNPSAEVLGQLAWCCEQAGEVHEARALLEHLAFGGELKKDPASRLPFDAKDHAQVIRLAQFEVAQKQFDRAEQLFNWLLLSGCLSPGLFAGLAEISRLRFDFQSAALLLGIARRLHPESKQGKVHVQHAKACGLTDDAASALESMAVACLANPAYVGSTAVIQEVMNRHIGALPYAEAMLFMELGESDNAVGRAMGLIARERPDEAERLLVGYTPRTANLVRYGLTLSLAYSYQGKLAEAMALISRLLREVPALSVYHEGMRLAVMANDYAWGETLMAEARGRGLEVGDVQERKIALGLGEIKQSYLTFRRIKSTGLFREYLGARYVQSLHGLDRGPDAKNLVVAFFGPGDEIRFASFYREFQAAAGDSRLVFTCDPRLLGLLSRHYTELEFVPSARIRTLSWLEHSKEHDQLAGADLHVFFDNRGWAQAQAADKVILVSDALGDVIEGYPSFKGQPYLKADPVRVQQWRERLPRPRAGELLVGLSWRSGVMSYARNEHYLAMEDLLPLFALEGVRFVNLQYDDCRDELAWLEERFPGRLLHFDDLDQFNDLDGVAALMECLDLVVAPATTVVELAGALGRPTLLLSNSSELHWRKIPGSRVDTWHNSILHVDAPVLGDKKGLVRQLAIELQQRVESCQPPVQAIA